MYTNITQATTYLHKQLTALYDSDAFVPEYIADVIFDNMIESLMQQEKLTADIAQELDNCKWHVGHMDEVLQRTVDWYDSLLQTHTAGVMWNMIDTSSIRFVG